MSRDLDLIGGGYLNHEDLPKNKQYLLKYFKNEVGKDFVCYFFAFGNYTHFVDHTGHQITKRSLVNFKDKLMKLEDAYVKARSDGDFSKVALLESGKYEL